MNTENIRSFMPEKVSTKLTRRYYAAGSPIIMAEHNNNYVFFLVEGEAEASIQNSEGGLATIYLYKPTNIFGELEPFYNDIEPVSIIAMTPCAVDVLYKDDFLDWLKSDFEATKILIRIIAEKLVRNSQLIEEISLLSVRERVLRCIAVYAYTNRLSSLSKKQLSIEVNSPIRSINRAIAECTRQGLFCYQNKQFYILNETAVMSSAPPTLKG